MNRLTIYFHENIFLLKNRVLNMRSTNMNANFNDDTML